MKSTYWRNKEFCNELRRCAEESSLFCWNRVFYLTLDGIHFFFLSVNLEGQTAISIDLRKMSVVRHDWNLIILVGKLLRRKYSPQTRV